MPIVRNPADPAPAPGCAWRCCRRCGDLVALPVRLTVCSDCAGPNRHRRRWP